MQKSVLILVAFWSLVVPAAEVLYIGDSHSYLHRENPPVAERRFGHVLIASLERGGRGVDYLAACGASPEDWARGSTTGCGYTERLDGHFRSVINANFPSVRGLWHPPGHRLLLVNLGDNMFSWSRVNGKSQATFDVGVFNREMSAFFQAIGGTQPGNCVWIGPTYHVEGNTYRKPNREVDRLYSALAAFLSGGCRLVDSRTMVISRDPGDGLHHGSSDSRTWAEAVLRQL